MGFHQLHQHTVLAMVNVQVSDPSFHAGVVTALLSLPLRYMHSPSEVCDLADVENSIELLAEFLCRIDENTDIDPFK